MTNSSNDRLDRIEDLLQRSILASDERMTRIEQNLEQSFNRSFQLLERVLRVQERTLDTQERTLENQRRQEQQTLENQRRQEQQIQILLDAATRHEATISRLDTILERLVYREGRNGDNQPPQIE